jgi:outer membrane lipoprotein carrier protein
MTKDYLAGTLSCRVLSRGVTAIKSGLSGKIKEAPAGAKSAIMPKAVFCNKVFFSGGTLPSAVKTQRGKLQKLAFTAVIFFIMSFLSCVSFAQDNNADDIFRKFSGVKSVESGFVMKKFVSISETPFESSGKFYFQKPASLKWEYIKPFSYGFDIDNGKISSWQEKDGKKETKDAGSQTFVKVLMQQLYAFISMDKETISKIYDMEIFDEKDFASGLILLPKNKNERQLVESVKIYFSKTIPAAQKVIIQNKNGDKTEIVFTDTIVK